MASQVDIANDAAIMLGQAPITSLTQTGNVPQALNAVWSTERDNELRANRWKFSIARGSLPVLASVPLSGPYNTQFALPAQCLKVLDVGTAYPGSDLSDYRTAPTNDDYSIEGNLILSNLPAPLAIRYVVQITDVGAFDASFAKMFACRLAKTCCFRITGSLTLVKAIAEEYKSAKIDALRAGAIETPPTVTPDDTWVLARMGDGGSNAWFED